MENLVEKLQEIVLHYGLNILAALLILFLGRIIGKMLKKLVRTLMQRSGVDETLISFAVSVGYVAFMAFVIIAALGKLGIPTASFVAIIGAAGLAIGLALQGSLENFAAGVMLIIFKPFKVGDFIEGGETSGVIQEIGIFATHLQSLDNKKVIVPNTKLTGNNIVNYMKQDDLRVDMVVGVGYGDDLDKVKAILKDILAQDSRILSEPAPVIGVLALADSSVNMAVRPWTNAENYWDVYLATLENIKKRFDAEGISIPYPQQEIHLIR